MKKLARSKGAWWRLDKRHRWHPPALAAPAEAEAEGSRATDSSRQQPDKLSQAAEQSGMANGEYTE